MNSHLWICALIALSFASGMAVESVRASKADSAPARVTGIGGVFFKAHEPQKLSEWYKQYLGIQLQAAGNSPTSPSFAAFDWLEKDDPKKEGSTAFAIFSDQSKYFAPSSSQFMINFRVVNLGQILDNLKKAGATPDAKIESDANGRSTWVMDPEGNKIELWEAIGK